MRETGEKGSGGHACPPEGPAATMPPLSAARGGAGGAWAGRALRADGCVSQVALSYMLALAALGLLAYLAAPQRRTALSAVGAARHPRRAAARGGSRRQGAAPPRRQSERDTQRRQSLLYDSVTVGPYGSYDAQTYYFGVNGVQQEGDGTMYQPEIVYDALAPEGERLVLAHARTHTHTALPSRLGCTASLLLHRLHRERERERTRTRPLHALAFHLMECVIEREREIDR